MMVLAKRVLIYLIGWSFILLGIIGLFLPILQGILFLVIGLLVLSKESKFAKSILHRFQERHPVQYQKIHEFNERVKKRLRDLLNTSSSRP